MRPTTLALEAGWTLAALIRPIEGHRSRWAEQVWDQARCRRVEMPDDLVRELGERADKKPELVAVVELSPRGATRRYEARRA